MFDPKSLLEAILAGAAKPSAPQPQASTGNAVDLGEILRRMGGASGQGGQGGGGGGGLSEILEKLGGAQQSGGGGQRGAGAGGGGLGDILGEIFGKAAGGQPNAPAGRGPAQETGGRMGGDRGASGSGGGDILEEIFGKQAGAQPVSRVPMQPQAPSTPNIPWGGGRAGSAVDVRARAEQLLAAIAAGQGTPDMIADLQDMVAKGQLEASAVIGGLGSVIVGGKPGRRINADAVRMGGLELIGAIAYTSYIGYQQDRGGRVSQVVPSAPAPKGSGFEAEAQTSETALLYVRTMIAAAAADGEIDAAEQQQLVGGLGALGLGHHATQFLQQELERPQSVEDLVKSATSPAMALQTYVSARLAIEPDTRDEQAFLQALAQGLGMDASLVAHIDAQTTALKA